ncbi:MAG: hypothetical protein KF850_12935 [Labilithrix sp.]|nr:hypothetical protein [Labilithrix sp.]
MRESSLRLRLAALVILTGAATSLTSAHAAAQTEPTPPVAPEAPPSEEPQPGPDAPPAVEPPPPPPPPVATPAPPPPPPVPAEPVLKAAPPEPPAAEESALGAGVTNPFAPAAGARGVRRDPFYVHIAPFVALVGGVKFDNPIQPPSVHRDNRVSAIMIADFGVRGELSDWISFESELMANGGPRLRGTSVYDGQAALQVRKQVIHVGKDRFHAEVGRVVDEASVDYFSLHVADTMMQDTATRDALLFSGFNLGNGARGTAEILPGLRVGLAANAGNPTSTSSILAVGGAFPPYDRIFFQAAQRTRQDLNGYPDDQFHAYVVTPSILYNHKYFEARSAAQMFVIDPNSNDNVSKNIRGYNIRLSLRAHLFDDMISPYLNGSLARNDVVDPGNVTRLSADKYTGLAEGGGVDFNYQRRFGNANGVGVQYTQNQFKVGDGVLTTNRYFNVGTTYWLAKNLAAGLRFALWSVEQRGQNTTGERSVIGTLRLVL